MNQSIQLYEENKRKLNKIKATELEDYNISKMLYTDIWHIPELNNIQKFQRVMAQILCKSVHLNKCDDDSHSPYIAVEVKTNNTIRHDNDIIFNNLYNYIKPAGHLLIYRKYVLDLKNAIKRCRLFIKYMKIFKAFSLFDNMFLAQRLVVVEELIELLEKEHVFIDRKVLLIFQEHDTLSNVIIQNAHMHNVRVISPQHGLPINRQADFFQVHFDGCCCDYKLLWNEFTKQQYISAGIDEKKLYVVGNTKKLNCEATENSNIESNQFGVLLDWPKGNNAIKCNKELLQIANELSKKYGLKCIVKLHPADNKEQYLDVVSENDVEFLKAEVMMEEYEKMVRFSLAHITSAIVDLIYDGCFVFIYKTEEEYPLETDSIYKFSNFNEFMANYNLWCENFERYKEEYVEIRNLYYTKNSKQLHDRFFSDLRLKVEGKEDIR